MHGLSKPFLWLAVATLGLAAAAAQPAGAPIEGTWDLSWMTKRGPRQSGYLVIARTGDDLRVEMHGRGKVRARGRATGSTFVVRGTRLAVPYRIEGRWQGDRMDGAFKVLSTSLRFTAARRRP